VSRPLDKPIVYCISEGLADDNNFGQVKQEIITRIKNAGRSGVTLFQIREKKLSAARLFDLSSEAADATRRIGVRLLVNGRADIALAAGANGVHLPSDGLPAAVLRRHVPEDFTIGVSVHTLDEAVAAKEAGADLVTFGPVFESPGKGIGVGLDALGMVCDRLGSFPVVGLGGVNETRIGSVLECGAAGVAAIRYLNECLASGKRVPV
jgi:thiamine-phosphate pyrophosphorylase